MKVKTKNSNLLKQRITVLLALLLCMFISSVEYITEETHAYPVEHHEDADPTDQSQTFLNVAVDAVVPFVVHVSNQVMYLIYEIVPNKGTTYITESISFLQPNQLVEILFEQIISTQGP